uniref:Uncharacterized protein n=1 Tax=Romanomermis culicivorax TaxID=13658 RepID=A0A915IU95_ROMCU
MLLSESLKEEGMCNHSKIPASKILRISDPSPKKAARPPDLRAPLHDCSKSVVVVVNGYQGCRAPVEKKYPFLQRNGDGMTEKAIEDDNRLAKHSAQLLRLSGKKTNQLSLVSNKMILSLN